MGGLLKAILVPADPSQPCRFTSVEGEWQELARAVGAQWMERVSITRTLKMVVDEEGLLNGKPINDRASRSLYPGLIVGDALLLSEGMTDNGPDFISLRDADVSHARILLARHGWQTPELNVSRKENDVPHSN